MNLNRVGSFFDMTKKELLELKEQIEKHEQELSEDKGALKQMMQELKSQGFTDVEMLKQEIDNIDETVNNLNNEYNQKIDEIEELL